MGPACAIRTSDELALELALEAVSDVAQSLCSPPILQRHVPIGDDTRIDGDWREYGDSPEVRHPEMQ